MRADVSAFKIFNISFFVITAMMILCSCSDTHSSWKSDYQELVDAWDRQTIQDDIDYHQRQIDKLKKAKKDLGMTENE